MQVPEGVAVSLQVLGCWVQSSANLPKLHSKSKSKSKSVIPSLKILFCHVPAHPLRLVSASTGVYKHIIPGPIRPEHNEAEEVRIG